MSNQPVSPMNRTPEQQGDLSRLRRIRDYILRILEITGDRGALNTCNGEDIDTLQENTLQAHLAVGNALSRLGDQSVMSQQDLGVPHQRRRHD